MPDSMPASAVLDREFLEIRAKILELAASFDRLARGDEDSIANDPRLLLIKQGLEILQEKQEGRAERIQLLFSQPYEPAWRKEFDME